MSGDADPASCLSNAPFEHVTHAQLTSHLLDVDGSAFVNECRVAGDDEERFEPRERSDDVLDHTIREVFLAGIANIFSKGKTAMEGLSGSGGEAAMSKGFSIAAVALISTAQLDQYLTNGRYVDAAMAMLRQIRHAFGF
ncbi:hypothetical protein IVA91_09450 [Bradyrhizobium sp. 153]|nr:hypothetical protein [Bradyrhizobium sp. 153]